MITTNKNLDDGQSNGTQCKCTKVKLKSQARPIWKNWEGRKVYTIAEYDVEWVEFEHTPHPPEGVQHRFCLKHMEIRKCIYGE